MRSETSPSILAGLAAAWRITCTVSIVALVESAVCGIAALPPFAGIATVMAHTATEPFLRIVMISAVAVPAYAVFALLLMPVSAFAQRLTGARSPVDETMYIRDMTWPLMRWVRCMVALQIVRIFAGHLFRGTPIWSVYLRMCGARIGRGVYVNTLGLSDYHLLSLDDHVVVGADAHISGHTVEAGFVKTGRVRLGRDVTVGIGSIVEIDVEIGAGSQVGALSFVPKHTRLDGNTVYAGIPVRRIQAA
jgi:serine acetyltransferase